MKTKILILCALILTTIGRAQINFIDVTTLSTNATSGGGYYISIPGVCTNALFTTTNPATIIVGDPLSLAFWKVNTNFNYIVNKMNAYMTNGSTGLTLGGDFSGTFTGFGGITNGVFTNGLYGGGTMVWSKITNCTFAGDGTYITSLNGANITGATVNSNALDALTFTWLQSFVMTNTAFTAGAITATSLAASLLDNGTSSGSTGYIPKANGDGTWTWTAPNIVADSAGNGGTTLHLKASDNGADQYLHVDSSGVIHVNGSP